MLHENKSLRERTGVALVAGVEELCLVVGCQAVVGVVRVEGEVAVRVACAMGEVAGLEMVPLQDSVVLD